MNRKQVYLMSVFSLALLLGCSKSEKNTPIQENAAPLVNIEPTQIVRSWKFNTYTDKVTGKQVNAINLISSNNDLGDFLITCDAGASRIEFISAKPISPKGKLAYRIDDSNLIKLTWTLNIKNGFASFTSDKSSHVSMLKTIYVSNDFFVSTIDPDGYNAESKFSTSGLKDAINQTRLICGWKESDFPSKI